MTSPYKRRRPSVVRNLWVYRRIVGLAAVLGLLLWFVWANNTPVTVALPFGLKPLTGTTGQVILLSALVGSVATALTITLALTWRRMRTGGPRSADLDDKGFPDDLPPSDYAAKASDEPPDRDWN